MDLSWLRPIVSGLVGAGVVWLLARAGRKPAPRRGDIRSLRYSTGFRVFAVALVPFSLFVAYAASQARPSQALVALFIAVGFVVSAVFLAYQAFFVSFEYDEQNIYYRSPLAGAKVIPWSEVQEIGYSSLLHSAYVRTPQVSRIWCSSMLEGSEELAEFLSVKAEEIFRAKEP